MSPEEPGRVYGAVLAVCAPIFFLVSVSSAPRDHPPTLRPVSGVLSASLPLLAQEDPQNEGPLGSYQEIFCVISRRLAATCASGHSRPPDQSGGADGAMSQAPDQSGDASMVGGALPRAFSLTLKMAILTDCKRVKR
eukprot:1176597-Prorocentrum_minimum.AAC.2